MLYDSAYLAHVQGIGKSRPMRMWVKSEVDDLKVPGDAHAEEEADVDQHLVHLLAPALSLPAARTTTVRKL